MALAKAVDEPQGRYPFIFLALVVSYIATGRLGLYLAVPPGYATAVFIPAGIAIAGTFVFGSRALPGIFVGSFLLNLWIRQDTAGQLDSIGIAAAATIAVASTLQAAIAGGVLRKFVRYPAALDTLGDLAVFYAALPLICLASASVSVAGLWGLGILRSEDLFGNWITWWTGDTFGALVTVPLMLVMVAEPRDLWRFRRPYVGLPTVITFGLFIWIFFESKNASILAAGSVSAGLLGAFLLFGTGHAFRSERLAARLRDKDAELQTIIDNTPFILTRCSRDLRFRFVSKGYAQMVGVAAESLIGKSIREFMGEAGFETIRPHIEMVLSGRRAVYESEVEFKTVGKRFLRVTYIPDVDGSGEIQGWIASIIDASLEQLSSQIQQRLSNIVESSDDAIISKDLNGVVVSWNKGAERIFGYSAEEMIGKSILTIIPKELHYEEPKILASVRRGEPIAHFETRRRRKDGGLVDISLTVSPVRDSLGRIIGASKIARDVTERKRARERMAADMHAVIRLNQLSGYLVRKDVELRNALAEILNVTVELCGADMGSVQLLDQSVGVLSTRAQRGLDESVIESLDELPKDDNYANAMTSGRRIIVNDVATSELLSGQPSQKTLLEGGVRALVSTPFIGSRGKLFGTISTYFRDRHLPNERELNFLDLLARQAADYLDRKRAEDMERTLLREVQHRSNNLLAVIQAIVHRTFSGKSSIAQIKSALEGRLQALGRANRQLVNSGQSGTNLEEIVRLELEPYEGRSSVEGAKVELGPQVAQKMYLAVHELATNAAKYGAFSDENGKVEVSWSVKNNGGNRALVFKWLERNGPPVVVPDAQGFGSTLIKTTFKDVTFDYRPEGLSCQINIPFETFISDDWESRPLDA